MTMNTRPGVSGASLLLNAHRLKERISRPSLHIQIVDDDAVTLHLAKILLSRDHEVTVSKTADEAVNDYVRIMPDLVFLDINLGEAQHNGFSILHTLHMLDWDTNVVMLSGNNSPQNIAEATRRGAMGFIPKPFTKEILFRYVEECKQRKEPPSWN